MTLLRPDIGADIAQSLYNQANQNNGVWDRWTHNQGGTHVMTSDPRHAAVASIYAFGGTTFDASGALSSMVHAATTVTAADLSRTGWNVMVVGERPSLDKYLQIGYVPSDGNAWGRAGETPPSRVEADRTGDRLRPSRRHPNCTWISAQFRPRSRVADQDPAHVAAVGARRPVSARHRR